MGIVAALFTCIVGLKSVGAGAVQHNDPVTFEYASHACLGHLHA